MDTKIKTEIQIYIEEIYRKRDTDAHRRIIQKKRHIYTYKRYRKKREKYTHKENTEIHTEKYGKIQR